MQFRFKFRWAYIYNKVGKLELRTGKFIFPSLKRSCIYTWMNVNLNLLPHFLF